MYLHNKYTNWYFNIINNAKNRQIIGYVEKHHIIPKSLGGTNDKENLVKLTAREHFICHLLLIRMLEGRNKFKMIAAAIRLANSRQGHIINSRSYEILKIQLGKISSILKTGQKQSIESNRKRSESLKRAYAEGRKSVSIEFREIMHNRNLGKTMSEETKQKIREARSKQIMKPISDETRKNLSIAQKKRWAKYHDTKSV